MGLFSFLFGNKSPSNVKVVSDHIWISQKAKFNGVLKELNERSNSESRVILLIAHFSDTLEHLNAIVAKYNGDTPMTATLAENLSIDIATYLKLDESSVIDLIVAERHPLLTVDDKLMQFAKELPCRCRLVHHLSLEDPLLKNFGGETLRGMLKALGMKEHEAIENAMVSRRVTGVQKKIQAQASGNLEANSAMEWMEKNISVGKKADAN